MVIAADVAVPLLTSPVQKLLGDRSRASVGRGECRRACTGSWRSAWSPVGPVVAGVAVLDPGGVVDLERDRRAHRGGADPHDVEVALRVELVVGGARCSRRCRCCTCASCTRRRCPWACPGPAIAPQSWGLLTCTTHHPAGATITLVGAAGPCWSVDPRARRLVAEGVARAAHRRGAVEVGGGGARRWSRCRCRTPAPKALLIVLSIVTTSWVGLSPIGDRDRGRAGVRVAVAAGHGDGRGLGGGEVVGQVGDAGRRGGVGGVLHALHLDVPARDVDRDGAQRASSGAAVKQAARMAT